MVDSKDTSEPAGTFRDILYRLRRDRGWSQSELARRVWGETTDSRGYKVARNRDRISAYEAGRAMPQRDTLEDIARVFGVSPSQLSPTFAAKNTKAPFEFKIVGNEAHVVMDAVMPISAANQIAAIMGILFK